MKFELVSMTRVWSRRYFDFILPICTPSLHIIPAICQRSAQAICPLFPEVPFPPNHIAIEGIAKTNF